MIDNDNFVVSREVAERSGLLSQKYRTADGRFILDRKSLGRITLTSEEYVTGLQGVEKVSREEAMTLIAQGGYVLGDEERNPSGNAPATEAEAVEAEAGDNDNITDEEE